MSRLDYSKARGHRPSEPAEKPKEKGWHPNQMVKPANSGRSLSAEEIAEYVAKMRNVRS